jgi:flagellar hook assembly protein FlgD
LYSGVVEEGYHTVSWNGTADNQKNVASGVYFYRLRCGNQIRQKKMLLLK